MLHFYDTLSREKQKFKPLRQEEVKVYFCGPTVYNYAHIGNLRTFVFEDYVIKALRYLGYRVKTTMNITDIDDKTIKESQKVGEKLGDFTQRYQKIFLQDLEKLSITPADNIIPISHIIDEMVKMINGLIKKGYAYLSEDGSVYYDIKKFRKYGNLAHLDFSGMKESVRIDNDEYDKENASDFVLWKAWKEEDGENYWEEEFVFLDEKKILKGRPGWHIECSACNAKVFGAQIDIHMGGVDLIFPHHQNEIAQSEAYFQKTFSKYWIHSGHLMVDGKKMSKSLNNFYTIKDIEERYENISKDILYRSLRLLFLNSKYSAEMDFSFSKLEQNFTNIKKIDETIKKLQRNLKKSKELPFNREIREDLQDFISRYIESLEDDFNMPEVLAIFYEYITYVNTQIDEGNLGSGEYYAFLDMFETFNQVLSLMKFDFESDEIPGDILAKFEERNTAKQERDFEKADSLRAELLELGYKIIDERDDVRIEKI